MSLVFFWFWAFLWNVFIDDEWLKDPEFAFTVRLRLMLVVSTILLSPIQISNCVLLLVGRTGSSRFHFDSPCLFSFMWKRVIIKGYLQVWDAVTGTKQFTFDGHDAPVYSVCPHHKENIQVWFLTLVYTPPNRHSHPPKKKNLKEWKRKLRWAWFMLSSLFSGNDTGILIHLCRILGNLDFCFQFTIA